MSSCSSSLSSVSTAALKIVVATRLHNRQATKPMNNESVQKRIANFFALCETAALACPQHCTVVEGVIGLDGQDIRLLHQVQTAIHHNTHHHHGNNHHLRNSVLLRALPITPWGHFVLALNALIGHALEQNNKKADDDVVVAVNAILFVSAETTATAQSFEHLFQHMMKVETMQEKSEGAASDAPVKMVLDDTTLVVGARLAGHDYHTLPSAGAGAGAGSSTTDDDNNGTSSSSTTTTDSPFVAVELNGRTTPWNTMALWNLRKLALTGFLLVSEGYLTPADEPSYGVEEVATIALIQTLLSGKNNYNNNNNSSDDDTEKGQPQDEQQLAKAKLVAVPGVLWDTSDFAHDPERQAWHESKMESKVSRADRQLKLVQLKGIVHHYY